MPIKITNFKGGVKYIDLDCLVHNNLGNYVRIRFDSLKFMSQLIQFVTTTTNLYTTKV